MRPGRVVAVIVGALFAALALGLLAGGTALVWAHATQRDDDGFYTSSRERLDAPGYAIRSEDIDLGADLRGWDPVSDVGSLRIRAARTDGGDVFVGIAPDAAVAAYLGGVNHDVLVSFDGQDDPDLRGIAGDRVPAPPTDQGFWAASVSGSGERSLEWQLESGDWTVVVMNADASAGVTVVADAGLRTGWLLGIGLGLLGGALVALALAVTLLVVGTRPEPSAAAPLPVAPTSAGSPPDGDAYPLRLDAHLDPALSRWMWLVKWILVIPHVVVLAFLWAAFVVLTVVAGVAILVTGRYPRGVFRFNVGVLRWTWRVTFYAVTLGSDRYPPFSLAPRPGDLATLELEPPERLSRGLVLVKWWLLAIPHYLIVGVFAGSITWAWAASGDDEVVALGGGLIGLLVMIAAVVLLVRGRYPVALFDFVLGMQRWTYRVLVYAALMTDRYPPFRLDTGGTDPGSASHVLPPPPPPAGTPPAPDESGQPTSSSVTMPSSV